MIIISHDRHFLNQVCTHIADLDFQQLKIYPGNYDDFMLASVQARAARRSRERQGQGSDLGPAGIRAALLGQRVQGAPGHLRASSNSRRSRSRRSGPHRARIRTSASSRARSCIARRSRWRSLSFTLSGRRTPKCSTNVSFNVEAGERIAIIGPNGIGKTTLMRCLAGELQPTTGRITWVENAQAGYMPQDPQAEFADKTDLFTWMSAVDRQGRRRSDRARHAGPAAVLGRRDQEVGEGAVRRREGPHDLRQADADASPTCC